MKIIMTTPSFYCALNFLPVVMLRPLHTSLHLTITQKWLNGSFNHYTKPNEALSLF